MKSLFLLVVLLPLCHSSNLTRSLAKEIIHKLNDLNLRYVNKKVNITSWNNVTVPSMSMLENTSVCMNVFKKELKHLLINLTVVEGTNPIVEITGNLNLLPSTGKEEDERCTTQRLPRATRKPFHQYIIFLQKFINSPAHS